LLEFEKSAEATLLRGRNLVEWNIYRQGRSDAPLAL